MATIVGFVKKVWGKLHGPRLNTAITDLRASQATIDGSGEREAREHNTERTTIATFSLQKEAYQKTLSLMYISLLLSVLALIISILAVVFALHSRVNVVVKLK